jgi:hypothetical protein
MKKLITILVLTLAQMALSQTRQQSFRYQLEISRGDFEDALK